METKGLYKIVLRYPYRASRRLLTFPLSKLENYYLTHNTESLEFPPIFIIGPPRSGTTLLYQLMVYSFEMAYFTNMAARFREAPVLATRLQLHSYQGRQDQKPSFKSDYGRTKGKLAPHEAGWFWNRWFPTEWNEGYNYTREGYLSEHDKFLMYQSVRGIEQAFEAPFINKNVKHSVRIRVLLEVFPKALFIQMKRNPFDNANSILKGRKERNENINDWWSVMPKEISYLKDKDYLEQICGQVFYIEKHIEEDITKVSKERLYVVRYDELCTNPKKELDKIADFVSAHGCNLRIKYGIPESFKKSEYKRESLGAEEEMIRTILIRYYGKGVIDEYSWKNL